MHIVRTVAFAFASVVPWALTSPARACPDCASARAAREAFFHGDVIGWSLAMLAPFVAVLLAIPLLTRVGTRTPRDGSHPRDRGALP